MPEPASAVRVAPAVWLVDKPAGPTSHDVVAAVRRRLPRRTKVGHAGTLDPFATGLLVVMTGRATRLAPYLTGLDKTYLATMRTGWTSASGDPEGPIEAAGEPATAEAVAAALPGFVGAQRQRVPALSAVKVGGERLYRRTRRGEEVEAPERGIVVHELRLAEDHGGGRVTVEARVSSGTYMRTLVADVGARLGCGAYCEALRRTAVGGLAVADAVAPDEVGGAGGLDPRAALAHLPARELSGEEAARVRHGGAVAAGPGAPADGPVALLAGGRLVAVAQPAADGALRPAVVIEDPEPR
ncbi:tRNA pseudouridine(55) synthase TruB [Miltoncostaea marina]|uniref:tRNA pseudouridine(55) synthase TruB n=1 Tax=Miltoncostaea marina TaxID=2843215 RepID=UPI001C3D1457|nr:tRNA pseudouridine(55) synthase TruB [Miltoncostaea marina]